VEWRTDLGCALAWCRAADLGSTPNFLSNATIRGLFIVFPVRQDEEGPKHRRDRARCSQVRDQCLRVGGECECHHRLGHVVPLKARLPLPATGPYEIVGYQAKLGVVRLARNARFHVWSTAAQPAGYPDQIIERYHYTGASAAGAVEHGTADITADGFDQTWPPAVTTSLEPRHSSQLYAAPLLTVLGLWLNTRLPPFNDVRVRQALNYAVDRKQLAEINGGSTRPR
jgi:ABC-type transport system substrate-binding protein